MDVNNKMMVQTARSSPGEVFIICKLCHRHSDTERKKTGFKTACKCQRNSTMDKALVLHATDIGSVSNNMPGPEYC